MMLKAADLWAYVRALGIPTAKPEHFDFDVILAAQAIIISAGVERVIIATQNVQHLMRFNTATVTATEWQDLT
jgi:2-hydroxychromene-2-carboxylate isomerase